MRIEMTANQLEPLAEAIAEKVLQQLETQQHREHGRLAYTEPEAAAALGVQPHVLRDARLRGEVNACKMGKRWLYPRAELERYLSEAQQRR
ncbi:MAG: helix-turn-helix domain-containing protein [Pirellulaceae bacterium]